MLQTDIKIGSTYRVRIGDRLAPVTVLRRIDGRGRARFACLTQDTGRQVTATAARLRPMPGTPEAAAERSRELAAAERRGLADTPRAWKLPEGLTMTYGPAAAVPGLIARVGRLPAASLTAGDRAGVDRVVDRMHCAEPAIEVCRRIRRGLSRFVWASIPAEVRRAVLLAGLERHAANRKLYRDVMGHGPLPSERMVADAVGVACGLGRMPT